MMKSERVVWMIGFKSEHLALTTNLQNSQTVYNGKTVHNTHDLPKV
jgi:hypothetical protein